MRPTAASGSFGLLANPRYRERAASNSKGSTCAGGPGCEPCLQALVTEALDARDALPRRLVRLVPVGSDRARPRRPAGDSGGRRPRAWLAGVAGGAVIAIPLVGSQVVGDGWQRRPRWRGERSRDERFVEWRQRRRRRRWQHDSVGSAVGGSSVWVGGRRQLDGSAVGAASSTGRVRSAPTGSGRARRRRSVRASDDGFRSGSGSATAARRVGGGSAARRVGGRAAVRRRVPVRAGSTTVGSGRQLDGLRSAAGSTTVRWRQLDGGGRVRSSRRVAVRRQLDDGCGARQLDGGSGRRRARRRGRARSARRGSGSAVGCDGYRSAAGSTSGSGGARSRPRRRQVLRRRRRSSRSRGAKRERAQALPLTT